MKISSLAAPTPAFRPALSVSRGEETVSYEEYQEWCNGGNPLPTSKEVKYSVLGGFAVLGGGLTYMITESWLMGLGGALAGAGLTALTWALPTAPQ